MRPKMMHGHLIRFRDLLSFNGGIKANEWSFMKKYPPTTV